MTAKERAAFVKLHTGVTGALANAGECPAQYAIGMLIDLSAKLIVQSVPAESIDAVVKETVRVLRTRIMFHQFESEQQEQDWPSTSPDRLQ